MKVCGRLHLLVSLSLVLVELANLVNHSRTCQITGVWDNIDYSDCYDMGCLADGEWNESPIRTTLRRKCPMGYSGYQYRYCSEFGVWNEIVTTDCGTNGETT